ncbi:hypothetical protein BsWGS_14761 [Bradybaena similaris]
MAYKGASRTFMAENRNTNETAATGVADPSAKSSNNVYTPLLASSGTSRNHPLHVDSPMKDKMLPFEKAAPKPLPMSMKKQIKRHVRKLPGENSRGKCLAVRPFLCCGSEVSLLSLVDGLDISDDNPKEKMTIIECTSSCIEQHTLDGAVSRQGSIVSRNSSFCKGENTLRGTALRKKRRKDKHTVTKKPWSQRLRGQWNSRWRVCQQQRAAAQLDLSHRTLANSDMQAAASLSDFNQISQRCRELSVSSLSEIADLGTLNPVDDISTIQIKRRVRRALEIADGIEVAPAALTRAYFPQRTLSCSPRHSTGSLPGSVDLSLLTTHSPPLLNDLVWQWQQSRNDSPVDQAMFSSPRIHTQVDFIHCLVPEQARILSCPFYWGVMDRYEAELLLDKKPEGTFLLRDSAQEDFLFSVSFRRYNRSLHARVEQWNHRFSFDAHDPAVFSSPSVCDLLEHFKDPTCCMFFEPLLTRALPRNFPFSLQHMCRAVICDCTSYDQIHLLPLPNSLKQFLRGYHYKQKVRVRHFDGPGELFDSAHMIVYSVD